LLFLGRWHPNKGIDLLLEALRLLSDEDWSLIETVLVAGGGTLNDEVLEGVNALKARGRPVTVTGYLDRTAACQALAAADFLLLPSRIESIPVVFSDALKFGLPVIAMPVGDLPVLIGPGMGVLALHVDSTAFSKAISVALRGEVTCDDRGLQDMSARFSIGMTAERILATVTS
jgi:glycosyltransferase involved in cell wall biosynthesis